jgi:hypothetical protein
MDFGTIETLSDKISAVVDEALKTERDSQPSRSYLGGSRLGVECRRSLYYEYHNVEKDADRGFSGSLYRIFDMGHDGEERVAEYLALAGFKIKTEDKFGHQFGFVLADERIKGHCDGVVMEVPESLKDLFPDEPGLWENKALGEKSWKDTKNKGCKKSKPVYYAQCQVYMKMFKLNWALFTALNRNTGEVYYEIIMYSPREADDFLAKGWDVITAESAVALPRVSSEPTFFQCKWCDYHETCWNEKEPSEAANKATTPDWAFD